MHHAGHHLISASSHCTQEFNKYYILEESETSCLVSQHRAVESTSQASAEQFDLDPNSRPIISKSDKTKLKGMPSSMPVP